MPLVGGRWPRNLAYDPGAGLARERGGERLGTSDERLAASGFEKLEAGLNLGKHGTGLKVAFCHIPPGFHCSHRVERLFETTCGHGPTGDPRLASPSGQEGGCRRHAFFACLRLPLP